MWKTRKCLCVLLIIYNKRLGLILSQLWRSWQVSVWSIDADFTGEWKGEWMAGGREDRQAMAYYNKHRLYRLQNCRRDRWLEVEWPRSTGPCGRPYERDVYKKVYEGVCVEPGLCIGRCKSVLSMYTRMDVQLQWKLYCVGLIRMNHCLLSNVSRCWWGYEPSLIIRD
jgi:hypothetical protein